MQNRYVGDIGDFAKFGLVRSLVGGSDLKTGIVWYLTPDETSNDGRHIDYLKEPFGGLRDCDEPLFDALAEVVHNGRRFVREIPGSGVLPPDTVYHDALLSYASGVSAAMRMAQRVAWFEGALASTAGCDLVVLDPDNGLESPSVGPQSVYGPKYAYFDELSRFVERGQSLVVYHHLDRSGTAEEQARRRMQEIQDRLQVELVVALRWLRVSPRFFFVIAAERHEDQLSRGIESLCAGPWSAHFELIQPWS